MRLPEPEEVGRGVNGTSAAAPLDIGVVSASSTAMALTARGVAEAEGDAASREAAATSRGASCWDALRDRMVLAGELEDSDEVCSGIETEAGGVRDGVLRRG